MDITPFIILIGLVLFQTVIDTIKKEGIVSIYMTDEHYGVLVDRDIALPFHQYYMQNGNAVEIRDLD